MHSEVKQIVECEPWPASDLQESPESLPVFLPQVFLGNRAEKTVIESYRPKDAQSLKRDERDKTLSLPAALYSGALYFGRGHIAFSRPGGGPVP